MPRRTLFRIEVDVDAQGNTATIHAKSAAVFSNWLLFRHTLIQLGLVDGKNVVVDLSQTRLVDHSVMETLHELQADFERARVTLQLTGLENHKPLSNHEFVARKRSAVPQ